jgi:fluoroquinolone transport system ATP-binding protein
MADAAELCDRVAFIVNGEIKALDSPHNLIMQKGAAKVAYTYFDDEEKHGECLLAHMAEDLVLQKLIHENRLCSIHSSEPNLNDIFIDVTGRALQ